jgi:hypothetical protein
MELAAARCSGRPGSLTVAAISYILTINRVAEMLGEDEDWLQDIADEMDPEDGCLTVIGIGEHGTTAFTRFGVERLTELVEMHKTDPSLLRRYIPSE